MYCNYGFMTVSPKWIPLYRETSGWVHCYENYEESKFEDTFMSCFNIWADYDQLSMDAVFFLQQCMSLEFSSLKFFFPVLSFLSKRRKQYSVLMRLFKCKINCCVFFKSETMMTNNLDCWRNTNSNNCFCIHHH